MRLTLLAGLAALGFGLARRPRARAVLRVSRVVADLDAAEAFYRNGLGFRRAAAGPLDPAVAALLLPGATARTVRLRLGTEEVELVQWDHDPAPYPAGSRSDDRWFQHLAIVTNDMRAAHAAAMAAGGRAISVNGPQPLPAPPGAQPGAETLVAFKFRDPDGHPLELIHFPPGQGPDGGRARWQKPGRTLGIDHSALSVGSTAASLVFFRRLGFRRADQTQNHGPAQSALDGIPNARATVTSLRLPNSSGMGLELLAYHPPGRAMPPHGADARVTDWTTLRTGRRVPRLLRDPDGHIFLLR